MKDVSASVVQGERRHFESLRRRAAPLDATLPRVGLHLAPVRLSWESWSGGLELAQG